MKYSNLFHELSRKTRNVVLLHVMFILSSGTVQAEPGTEAEQPDRQVQVFAKILEESLDNSGLGDWGASILGARTPFASDLRADYIPTVGMLVYVPVSFPINAPEGAADPKTATGTPEDLWEKYLGASNKPEPVEISIVQPTANADIAPPAPKLGDPATGDSAAPKDKEILGTFRSPQDSGFAPQGVAAGQVYNDRVELRMDRLVSRVSVPYDGERASKLHDTILDVVAQYGHRLTCLKDGERLLVLIEAPARSEVAKTVRTAAPGGVPVFTLTVAGQKERKLLAVPQSAITAKTTREALQTEVTGISY